MEVIPKLTLEQQKLSRLRQERVSVEREIGLLAYNPIPGELGTKELRSLEEKSAKLQEQALKLWRKIELMNQRGSIAE